MRRNTTTIRRIALCFCVLFAAAQLSALTWADALDAASKASSAVRKAKSDLDSARMKSAASNSLWSSNLDVQSTVNQQGVNAKLDVSVPILSNLSVSANSGVSIPFTTDPSASVGASVSWSPFKTDNAADSTAQALERAEASYQSSLDALETKLYQSWTSVWLATKQVALSEERLRLAESSLVVQVALEQAGASSTSDKNKAIDERNNSTKELLSSKSSLMKARIALALTVGKKEAELGDLEDPQFPADVYAAKFGTNDSMEAWIASAIEANADVKSALRDVYWATPSAIPAVLSNGNPSLSASLSWDGKGPGSLSWNVGVNFSLAAERFSGRDEAQEKLTYENALASLSDMRNQVASNIRSSIFDYQLRSEAYKSAQNQLAEAEQNLAESQLLFKAGNLSELDFEQVKYQRDLSAQQALSAQVDLCSAVRTLRDMDPDK